MSSKCLGRLVPRPLFDFTERGQTRRKTNIVQISYNKTCNDEYTSNAIPVPGLSSGTRESGSAEAEFVIKGLIYLEACACFSVHSGIQF